MYYLIAVLLIYYPMQESMLYHFNNVTDAADWQIINDGVMGGRSKGDFYLNNEGNGVFSGTVSLENNGGFSLVRHQLPKINSENYNSFQIRLKGDGKRYQFRVREEANSAHAYVSYFNTTGEWQTIEILFDEMYPVFRGRKLSQPDFNGTYLEEIGFLIGNKNEESFMLEIEKIELSTAKSSQY